MSVRPRLLGEQLVARGVLDRAALVPILDDATQSGERIGQALVRAGLVTDRDVGQALADQLGLEVAPSEITPTDEAWRHVPRELAESRRLVPISSSGRTIVVAMEDPLDVRSIEDVRFVSGRSVDVRIATPASITSALGRHSAAEADAVAPDPSPRPTPSLSATRMVDSILRTAIDRGASDIHIEENPDDVRARARVDGVLSPLMDLPSEARRTVLSRLKVLAELDIADRRRAQDGRVRFEHAGRRLSLRISTLPLVGGEKAVVRILDADAAPTSLDGLGLATTALSDVRALLTRGEGVVLAAGPTGSGKSTTLFAALSELDRTTRNVVTIEDPVEYRLDGTSQIQVDERAGLGFPEALRSVLRQDPDVVMVGEIRDRATAEIAMAAAVTGHLVLSTIHANDAPSAVTRLLQMGVPRHLVSAGLAGVVAQRLVRRTCGRCRGHGCDRCGRGLSGRTGIYQLLTVSDPMRDAIARGAATSEIRRLAVEGGTRSLASDARRAVAAGLTTPHEVSALLVGETLLGRPCASCDRQVPHGAEGCPWCGRPSRRRCPCGTELASAWRYCPSCLRKAA